jgi:hypothetical protein
MSALELARRISEYGASEIVLIRPLPDHSSAETGIESVTTICRIASPSDGAAPPSPPQKPRRLLRF